MTENIQPKENEAVTPPDLDEKARQEDTGRPERLQKLTALVEELFPGQELAALREDIVKRSFNVPQYGEYHNEGMFMDTHLSMMLEKLDDVEQGKLSEEIPADLRAAMQRHAAANRKTLQIYALLHDIAKADCLNIKYKDGTEKEISWEEWQQMAPDEVKTNAVKLKEYFDREGIIEVGFQHKDKTHSEEGGKKVAPIADAAGVPAHMVTAISKHDVAYSSSKIATKTYEKHWGSLTDEEREWALTAYYLDKISILRRDGQPDLSNFIYYANTLHNIKIIKVVEQKLRPDGKVPAELDSRKVDKTIVDLKNFASKITEDAVAIAARLYEECRFTTYDRAKLEQNLKALIITGQIKQEVADELVGTLQENGVLDEKRFKAARGKLGKANSLITPILEASRK